MNVEPILALALIVVLGAAAQWLAWRVRLPSILLLLLFGFLAGPVAGWIEPDRLFGELLLPIVSLSVALILFEGGLNLRFAELRGVGLVVRNLATIGALVTWIIAAGAAHLLVGLELPLAVLLGAILVVTGPTVVLPLLRHIRPSGPAGAILKWEGIIIDPIGAVLAVLVFETVLTGRPEEAAAHIALALLKTIAVGGGLGLLAAALLVITLQRHWLPDSLQTSISLMLVVAAFAASNRVQPESGLLAVTIMGIALANQQRADMQRIAEFKENLQSFLLAALFILLSARLRLSDLRAVAWETALFVGVLILLARPLAVLASSLKRGLDRRQLAFLMCMAPRGIVAAAIASVFALALEEQGYAQAQKLVPVIFGTIVGTVLVYGLLAPRMARMLGLSDPSPQGVLIVGAGPFPRAIAKALMDQSLRVLLVDTNRDNVAAARWAGLPAHQGSILREELLDEIDLAGIGKLLAMTPSDEVNILAVRRFARIFGGAEVYQLPPKGTDTGRTDLAKRLPGRPLFSTNATAGRLDEAMRRGAVVNAATLGAAHDLEPVLKHHGHDALHLFIVTEKRRLTILTADQRVTPKGGQTVAALIGADASLHGK